MADGKLEIINKNIKRWLNADGQLHRLRNRPACIYYENKVYFVNGRLHRTDGPAVNDDYIEKWCIDGILHRIGGPALITKNHNNYNRSEWLQNGKYYREDFLPTVEYKNGKKEWHTLIATDSRDYNFYIWTNNQKTWRILAGCRNFTVGQALKHWGKNIRNNPEAMEIVKQGICLIAAEKSRIAADKVRQS